ncbi:MAG: hypothetical protein MZV49_07060 [Rhodopseudomonas palustris]|nr:hypothetical protein [Rhodopseudomonas palustris]
MTRGSFQAAVGEDGKTMVGNRYVVSSPLTGRLLRPDLKAGDAVKAGARVATLLPAHADRSIRAPGRSWKSRASAPPKRPCGRHRPRTRSRRRSGSAQARRDYDRRARTAAPRAPATNQQLEREELSLRVAERDRAAAELRRHVTEHERDQTRALMRRTTDTRRLGRAMGHHRAGVGTSAARDGRKARQVVTAGAPLIEIGDPRDLEVIADVLTTQAVGDQTRVRR